MKKFKHLEPGELFKFTPHGSVSRAKVCKNDGRVFWEYETPDGEVYDIGQNPDVYVKVTKTIEVWE